MGKVNLVQSLSILEMKNISKETADQEGYIFDNEMGLKNKKDKSKTIWTDNDRNGYYDTKEVTDKYGKKRIFKLNESANAVQKVQNEVFIPFSKKADNYYKSQVHMNGKVEAFSQGDEGDCWLLSGIDSVSRVNQSAIKELLSEDKDGNIVVTFKGNNKKYVVTQQEIFESKGRLSTGDDDVRAIELATEKYRKELIAKKANMPFTDHAIDQSDPLKGGTGSEAYKLLTGKDSEIADDNKKFIENLQQKPNAKASVVTFKADIGSMKAQHIFTVVGADNEYVSIVNPWETKKIIKVRKDEFLNNSYKITAVPNNSI